MKVRDQLKQNPYGSLIWRIFIGAVGGLITMIGTIFLFAPGPGILVLLAGLGILATEFAWAANALRRTKSIAQATSAKIGIPLWVKYLIAAIGAVASILYVLVFHA
jgi:hypothetical protein